MMVFMPMSRTLFIALALYCLQSAEVSGHLNQPQPQPQVIPQYIPVPQYQPQPQVIPIPQYQQQPQYIPVPQYIPQYITVPQYVPQPQMAYYPKPSYHHRPHFDCYRGMQLDQLIDDMDRIDKQAELYSGGRPWH